MIKFFRKIRQNLLMENKTGKYFKYAIGEIVLVVVGILIALQINNWNESRKQETKKQSYYKQLITDIDKDSIVIYRLIEVTQKGVDDYQNYLKLFEKPDLEINTILKGLYDVKRTAESIIFNDNTVVTLISSGDINLMPIEIRNGLLDIKRRKDYAKEIDRLNNSFYTDVSINTFQKGGWNIESRLENQPKYADYLKFFQNKQERVLILEGAFEIKNFSDKSRIEGLKRIQNEISLLKKDIQAEIK